MAEDNMTLGYLMGQGESNNGWGDFGGIWGIIILAMIFGNGGFGFGGFGGGYGGGALTRAELYDGFAIQNIDSAVRNVQNGISDATYALNNSITSGFHGVDRAICDVGYAMKDCCCTTQRSIDGVNFNMATQFCNLGNAMQSGFRDVIDANRANTQQIMDFLVQEKLASKDARIAALEGQLGRAEQNGIIRAAIDASAAEIIRRTGNDYPTPAYWVQAPTPVQVPCGWGQRDGGCGCGCGF